MGFEKFTTRVRELSSLLSFVVSISMILVILVNVRTLQSTIIGTTASIVYVIFVGYLLGKAFLTQEEAFLKSIFGVFLLISLFVMVGTPIVVVHVLDLLGLGVTMSAPIVITAIYMKLKKRNSRKHEISAEKTDNTPYFSPIYGVFIVLIAYTTYLLVRARSGWVYGTVWEVVPSSFFIAYFATAFVLLSIILYSKTRTSSKLLITVVFSIISLSVFAIVLYPDNYGDPILHMASARTIYNYGTIRGGETLKPFIVYWLLKEKALPLLTAILAKMSMIDVYWVHSFITPLLWGTFVPLTAYRVTKIVIGKERVSLLAAFLAAIFSDFIGWGSRSTGNSLGFAVFFVSLYFSLSYLMSDNNKKVMLLLATLATLASGLIHTLTGSMSLIFLFLAISLKRYKVAKLQSPRMAFINIVISIFVSILAIQALFAINNVVYIFFASEAGVAAGEHLVVFNFEKLLQTDMWELIFGEYVRYSFKDLVVLSAMLFFGLIGFAYALRKELHPKNGKVATLFMFLAFVTCLIDYTILQYAMDEPLFGPGRLWTFRDFIATPYAALAIISVIEFLEGGISRKIRRLIFRSRVINLPTRKILVGVLVSVSLSAFAVPSIDKAYNWLRTGHPTQLEVDAIKYIDENTPGRYVVLADHHTTVVGWGFIGGTPEKAFVSYYGSGPPTVAEVMESMRTYESGVGYFLAGPFTWGTDFKGVVTEASRIFGLFKTISDENGVIYIFQYRIPFLPAEFQGAFYWDTPPSYIIQNELLRVTFNPEGKNFDIVDPWGKLYESLDLNETLVDGMPLGNSTSIEYYSASTDTWNELSQSEPIPLSQQLKFRLSFERASLIGSIERGQRSVQLQWQGAHQSTLSLRVGDLERLYIPGLVEGRDSYNVSSRDYGLFYTMSRTSNVVLRPAYDRDISSSSITFNEIRNYCGFTMPRGYLWYDLYVENQANENQWSHVEMWTSDEIYGGGFGGPSDYSLDDGKTWNNLYVSYPPPLPIKTLGGVEVDWVVSRPGIGGEKPVWWMGSVGSYDFPMNFTESGGGQSRLLFGLYLPARDSALLRVGYSTYYTSPLRITYVFDDSHNVSYGLFNMRESLIKFYNYGSSEYVGGFASAIRPTAVSITEDSGQIKHLLISIPPNTDFSLSSSGRVDTSTDNNGDGIPDYIQG